MLIRTFTTACSKANAARDWHRLHHLACTAVTALDELGVRSPRLEQYKDFAALCITFDEVSL